MVKFLDQFKTLFIAVFLFILIGLLPLVSIGQSQYGVHSLNPSVSQTIIIPVNLNYVIGNFQDLSPEAVGANATYATLTIPADPENKGTSKQSAKLIFESTKSESVTRTQISPVINVMDRDSAVFTIANVTGGIYGYSATEIPAASFTGLIMDGTFGVFASAWIDSISSASRSAEPYIQLGSDINLYGTYYMDLRPWRKIRFVRTYEIDSPPSGNQRDEINLLTIGK